MKLHVLVWLLAVAPVAAEDLQSDLLERFERVPLAHLPTPFEKLENLTEAIGGPPLYIKRDDQTGLAFGGNKARKLEFMFEKGYFEGSRGVVFVHTGGTPALFVYENDLLEHVALDPPSSP